MDGDAPAPHLRRVPLHLTKVAFGCTKVGTLRDRLLARASDGKSFVGTRYKPKRADDLAGGSLYWIIKHRIVARSPILGFAEDPDDAQRIRILVAEDLVPVRAVPRRAHQGWRYLEPGDAPADLSDGEAEGLSALPYAMAAELAALALI